MEREYSEFVLRLGQAVAQHRCGRLDVCLRSREFNTLYDAARGNNNEEYKGALLAVTSTDSKVRFLAAPAAWGMVNTALDKIIRVDPGIRARREAERKWLEANKAAPAAEKK